MTTRPTAEQKAAREQLAENRTKAREKKLRDRRLYRVGEVMEAHGYEDPAEVEKLMRDIERDRDSEASFNAAIERALEESDRAFAEERRLEIESPFLALQPSVRRQPPACTPHVGPMLVAACAGTLLGLSVCELSRRWKRGGAGWTR
ncbi:MAG: hypothetical protein M3Q29_16070 [Chloroflexota bacterium]|nr:hypothetical protein [Chloroflexota bacterium]